MYIRGYTNPFAGRTLYSIPETRTAINFVAEKTACVPFRHVRVGGAGEVAPLDDNIQRVLAVRPNPFNSPQTLINVVITRLLVNSRAYLYPEWEGSKLRALYPLPFATHTLERNGEAGPQLIVFQGDRGPIKFLLEDIIVLNRFPALGETKGLMSSTDPASNYAEILSTIQGQAVEDAKTSGRVMGVLETQFQLTGKDLQKKLEEFKNLYLTAENTTGLGMIPSGYKFTPVNLAKSPLNNELLNTITRQLYNYYGVSADIINGAATELQYEQFVDNTVKPICYQLEEELTYKLFTDREISQGHRVQAATMDLEISTLQAKTAFIKEMIFAGVLSRNEARVWLGRGKGDAELDVFQISKNFETLKPGNYQVEGGTEPQDGADKGKDGAAEGQAS